MARLITVLNQLPACTHEYRLAIGMSIKDAAREIGISSSTLHGFEKGTDLRTETMKRIVVWLEEKQSEQLGRTIEINVEPPQMKNYTTRLAANVTLCGCYIGSGSTGHSCGP